MFTFHYTDSTLIRLFYLYSRIYLKPRTFQLTDTGGSSMNIKRGKEREMRYSSLNNIRILNFITSFTDYVMKSGR